MRIILNIKGIPYDYIAINLLEKQQKSQDYSVYNPLGQVPCLLGPNFGICQSLAIIRYLEDVHPNPSTIPSDPILKAKMFEICEIINSGIHPVSNGPFLERIEKLGGDRNEVAITILTNGFNSIENILEKTAGLYCIGDNLTVADACLVPQVYNSRKYNLDMSKYPLISRIYQSLILISEIQQAAPENQIDFSHGH